MVDTTIEKAVLVTDTFIPYVSPSNDIKFKILDKEINS